MRGTPGRRHSQSTVSTSSLTEVYSGSKPRRSAGPSSAERTTSPLTSFLSYWKQLVKIACSRFRFPSPDQNVLRYFTLSKKQRPTSSGQSVYASSSFRNVLETNNMTQMFRPEVKAKIALTTKKHLFESHKTNE